MPLSASTLRRLLRHDMYPRSAMYDPYWVIDNEMGPNVIWIAEALTQVMELRAGIRVLDLGSGKAISSIFLAREFGVQVWAVDVRIEATDNQRRVEEAGLASSVFPMQAEAHALPFPARFFDAVISLGSYHYFGTDELYIGYIGRFLRAGCKIGIVVPGVTDEVDCDEGLRRQITLYWDWCAFHGPIWWRRHWERSNMVEVEHASLLPDGWQDWLRFNQICARHLDKPEHEETALLGSKVGPLLGLSRVVARKGNLPDDAWVWW